MWRDRLAADVALPVVDESVDRIKAILDERPLYIGIETTNICNAACVFCAYPKMQREKGVMSPELFEKVIGDYADMGGGAVGLTPIVGDVLVDPHLMSRLRLLRDANEVTHVALTTNAIAWKRFGERDRVAILESTSSISISLGGVDSDSYETMFAVDRYEKVRSAIEDMCELKSRHGLSCDLHLLFRVNRPIDELFADAGMDAFRRPEITSISSINNFGNWGGLVGREDLPAGAHLVSIEDSPAMIRESKKNPCFVHYVNPEITYAGLVSACGCMNAETSELILGDINRQHLRDIWQGAVRQELMSSFGTDDLPGICKKCSYYQDGEKFLASPAFGEFAVGDNPWEVLRNGVVTTPGEQLAETLRRLLPMNLRRIALFGAGTFTRLALSSPDMKAHRRSIVAVIDDNCDLHGTQLLDWKVVSREQIAALKIDAIILSTDCHGDTMWRATRELRDRGIRVVMLCDP